MADATKNIKFRTTVENKVAIDSFDQLGASVQKLNPELSKVAVTTTGKLSPAIQNFSRRDLGIFTSQLLSTTNITGRFNAQLSNVATGLASGGIIGAGFAAGAAAINYLTEQIKLANKETENMINSMKELIKVQTKDGAFNIDPSKIGEGISLLRSAISNLPKTFATFGGQLIEVPHPDRKVFEEALILLEGLKEKEDARLKVVELLTNAGLTYTEVIKKQNEETEEQIKKAKALNDALLENPAFGAGRFKFGHRAGNLLSKEGGAKSMPITAAVYDWSKDTNIQQMEEIAMGWRGVLDSQFSMFWDKTFGYANSLLEMLLKSTFETLLSQFATSFISFLPGGGLFGFIGGLFGGGGAGGALGGSPIILKIGDEEVGTFVKRGNEYNRMRRLN